MAMYIDEFEKAMGAFDFGSHQDVIQYLETLKHQGLKIEDAYEYVKAKQERLSKEKGGFRAGKPKEGVSISCPECPALMFLYPVNYSPSTQTGDLTDMSVWLCQRYKCMHTIYNKETIEELSSKGGT